MSHLCSSIYKVSADRNESSLASAQLCYFCKENFNNLRSILLKL